MHHDWRSHGDIDWEHDTVVIGSRGTIDHRVDMASSRVTLREKGKSMFNNVGDPMKTIVVKVQPNKTPEVVSEHQCIGNACEEQMVLNEMAEGTDVIFVVKETHGCMIETV